MVDIRRSKFWRRLGSELDTRLRGKNERGGFQPSSPGRGGVARGARDGGVSPSRWRDTPPSGLGQPPPLPGEDEGFAAAVGRIQTFSPRGQESSPPPRPVLSHHRIRRHAGLDPASRSSLRKEQRPAAHDLSGDHKTSPKPSASASRHRLPAMLRASPRSSHYRPGGRPVPARPSSSIWGRRRAGPPHNRRRACHNIARPPGSATS